MSDRWTWVEEGEEDEEKEEEKHGKLIMLIERALRIFIDWFNPIDSSSQPYWWIEDEVLMKEKTIIKTSLDHNEDSAEQNTHH